MSRKLDYIIVVDLEATCWKTPEEQGDQTSEIIEWGIACLSIDNKKVFVKPCRGHVEDARCLKCFDRGYLDSILVKPKLSTVSEFCTELTGFTQEDLKYGLTYKSSVTRLQNNYGPKNRIWASWGNYDQWKIEELCKLFGVKYPFGPTHYNIKDLYAAKFQLPKPLGLGDAMNHANIPFKGQPHRGADDAWNAARLLERVLYQ